MLVRRRTLGFLLALHAALAALVCVALGRRGRERRTDAVRAGKAVLHGGPYTLTTDDPIVVPRQTAP